MKMKIKKAILEKCNDSGYIFKWEVIKVVMIEDDNGNDEPYFETINENGDKEYIPVEQFEFKYRFKTD